MRHLIIVTGFGLLWLGGLVAALAADPEIFIAKEVSGNRISTDREISVSFHGVRLADQRTNAGAYRAGQRYLKDHVLGQPITLDAAPFSEIRSTRNRYGDLLAKIVTEDGKWLQQELIAAGYGWWSGAGNYPVDLRKQLVAAEKVAEQQKRGLWQMFSIVDANGPKQSFANGEFIIAKGVIRDVHSTATMIYLNFGTDWRSDFTAAISAQNRKKFEQQGWKLASLKNKLVRMRGLVRFYNGPYLELSFPEQLDIDGMTDG